MGGKPTVPIPTELRAFVKTVWSVVRATKRENMDAVDLRARSHSMESPSLDNHAVGDVQY